MSSHWAVLLCAVATMVLQYLRGTSGGSSLPPVADPDPCVPPRNASAPTGLRGYARFHANDSLIGRPVPCTRDDKICFRHNLIFNSYFGRCRCIGPSLGNCFHMPNRTEFEHGSGRLIGVCLPYKDPCPGYRMAYDGRCYRKEVVRDVICGCDTKPLRHFLDGVECRKIPLTAIKVHQPEEEGRCLIPDLRFRQPERSHFFADRSPQIPKTLKCEPQQAMCSQWNVWFSEYNDCYELQSKGPCSEDHVVALDIEAASRGYAVATCVHERGGCPPSYMRMSFDGKCHEEREIEIATPGSVYRNIYGHNIVVPGYEQIKFSLVKERDQICEITPSVVTPALTFKPLEPPCGTNDRGKCNLYDVLSEPPKPEL